MHERPPTPVRDTALDKAVCLIRDDADRESAAAELADLRQQLDAAVRERDEAKNDWMIAADSAANLVKRNYDLRAELAGLREALEDAARDCDAVANTDGVFGGEKRAWKAIAVKLRAALKGPPK